MKEYSFEELGYLNVKQCEAIKECMQGYSYMKFDINWSNMAGNCILIIATDYKASKKEIKNFFLSCLIANLLRKVRT